MRHTNGTVNIVANSFIFIIGLQVSLIYFHAGVAKLQVEEWVNGTCTYYWFTHPQVGAPEWFRDSVYWLMAKPWIVVFVTWGTLAFEIFLSMALFLRKGNYTWKTILFFGIMFHLGIVLIHGLISFFFAMSGSLFLYLAPATTYLHIKSISGKDKNTDARQLNNSVLAPQII